MVPGFLLPELLACEIQNLVGLAGCGAFEPSHQDCDRDFRLDQHVYVVQHDDPRFKVVEISFGRAFHD